jgi:hypothetical protein
MKINALKGNRKIKHLRERYQLFGAKSFDKGIEKKRKVLAFN